MSPSDFSALWVTLKLAMLATSILLILGTPLAWWLAHSRARLRFLVEALVALPLVLPPTVLGFYLMISLSSHGFIGGLSEWLGGQSLAFTFTGLIIGSVIYSLPFVVQPIQNAFAVIGRRPMDVAATLGASPINRFFTIAVPQARAGFITASVLGFAHTVGEFGVVLMVGGNIPGETQVLSIAIYDHVEALEYTHAHLLSAGLLLLSFLMLTGIYSLHRRFTLIPV